MSMITTKDGTQICFKDWGKGQPIIFSHGWPLSADAFEDQMFFLTSRGYRCIAHDRRGHGRSSQPWNGNDLDTYADDLAELVEALDLNDAIHVGHSTGGGEVARYIGRHGTQRVAKAVLIGAIPPLMLKTAANPGGTPMEVFDRLRASVQADRSQFWKDLCMPFYGYNRPGAKILEGVRESFWMQGMTAGIRKIILGGMLANMCVESHLRELLERGLEVAVVKDGTAGPRHPEWGDGYEAAIINYRFLAHAVWSTDEAVERMR